MAEAITRLGVQHHLGRASRATGEIDDARIVAAGQIAVVVRCGVPHAGIKVGPARLLGTDDQPGTPKILNFDRALGVSDDGADGGGFNAIADVLRSKQWRAGDWHRAEFGQAKHRDPPLRDAR